jgi:hypothetical protein
VTSLIAELLYALCSLTLAVSSVYLLLRDRRSPVARWFVALCLALLVWVVTLFLFSRSNDPGYILQVGRANFAAVSLAVYFGWRFVRSLAQRPSRPFETWLLWISLGLSAVSLLTSLVDRAELVAPGGRHTTIYGSLFPLYVLHIVVLLVASIWTTFRSSRRLESRSDSLSDQLLLVGWGIMATGGVSLASNALLPAMLGDFRWIDVGPLSTLAFLVCVAYAVVRHQLFDIRVFVRRTLVLGIALSLVLAAYSALVLLATDAFATSESGGVTRFGVLVLAFSFDPIRRFLEKRIDRLLFPEQRRHRKVS